MSPQQPPVVILLPYRPSCVVRLQRRLPTMRCLERSKAYFRPLVGLFSVISLVYLNFGGKISYSFPLLLKWQLPTLTFVSTNASHFVETTTGRPLFINGWNSYWLMDQSIWTPSRARVSKMLRRGAKMGMTVCRTWAFSDGGPNALQISPGLFDERVFQVIFFDGGGVVEEDGIFYLF